jgi:serine protease
MQLKHLAHALSVLVIGLAAGSSRALAQATPNVHIMKQQTAAATSQPEPFSTTPNTESVKPESSNVNYNGGPLLQDPNIYAIYWGPKKNFPAEMVTGMDDFFGAYGSTSYTDIMTQYLGANPAPSFNPDTNTWHDTSQPPAQGSVVNIGHEACKFINRLGGGPDPDGIYVVLTSNFPNQKKYCAWHSWWACESAPDTDFAIAYLPDLRGVSGCQVAPVLPGVTNPYGSAVRADANVAAHELSESITDPFPDSGWIDSSGNEIADKCDFQFSSPVELNDGYTWQIQELWSNNDGGCIQSE